MACNFFSIIKKLDNHSPYFKSAISISEIFFDYDYDSQFQLAGLFFPDFLNDRTCNEEISSIAGQEIADLCERSIIVFNKISESDRSSISTKEFPIDALLLINAHLLSELREIFENYISIGRDVWKEYKTGSKGKFEQFRKFADVLENNKDSRLDILRGPFQRELDEFYLRVKDDKSRRGDYIEWADVLSIINSNKNKNPLAMEKIGEKLWNIFDEKGLTKYEDEFDKKKIFLRIITLFEIIREFENLAANILITEAENDYRLYLLNNLNIDCECLQRISGNYYIQSSELETLLNCAMNKEKDCIASALIQKFNKYEIFELLLSGFIIDDDIEDDEELSEEEIRELTFENCYNRVLADEDGPGGYREMRIFDWIGNSFKLKVL